MYAKRFDKKKKAPNWIERHPEVQGILWVACAIALLLCLVSFNAAEHTSNFLGIVGHILAGSWYFTFGVGSYAIVLALLWYGMRLMFMQDPPVGAMQIASIFLAGSMLSLILSVIAAPSFELILSRSFGFETAKLKLGGVPFYLTYTYALSSLVNAAGTLLIASVGLFLSLAYFLQLPLKTWFLEAKDTLFNKNMPGKIVNIQELELDITPKKAKIPSYRKTPQLALPVNEDDFQEPIQAKRIYPTETKPEKVVEKIKEIAPKAKTDISLPSLDLLNTIKKSDPSLLVKELKSKADLLEETLLSFGIEAKVGQIHCGPTITSFEVHPAVGVKIGKIRTLENDIALNLEAKAIRIIAPIPGKAAVGIEVPNSVPQEVSFKEVLAAYQQMGSPFRIPMLLGKGVNGDLVIADLAKMPHCIIAGATGSGKSVCINSIVMSILMCAKPDEIRLLMIDPKKVELTQYTELPHMLAPVITEPHNACLALNWLVKEMEKRYEILKLTGQRNIEAFNKRKINVEQEKSFHHVQIPEKFPYYVCLVDELADLMMVSSQDIETPIARIAQMARAVGIHMILATQRPSREVITGLIRANFPARIAFKVASRINSQIILDDVGAENMLGNGDMLFLMPGSSSLIRAQGVFVRDEEIAKVVESITSQAPPQYLISSFDNIQLPSAEQEDEAEDTLFNDAKSVILSTGNASTTFLQRKLKIGYARAASLMDMLEARGVVGPQEGARPRRILFPKNAQGHDDEDFEDD